MPLHLPALMETEAGDLSDDVEGLHSQAHAPSILTAKDWQQCRPGHSTYQSIKEPGAGQVRWSDQEGVSESQCFILAGY